MPPIGNTTKCRRPKTAKFGVFYHPSATEQTDRDKTWHVSVDLGSTPTYQIWPLSVNGARYRNPQMSTFAKIAVFHPWKMTQQMDSNEIWRVSADHESTALAKFGPHRQMGMGTRAPQNVKILLKVIFWKFLPCSGLKNILIQTNLD